MEIKDIEELMLNIVTLFAKEFGNKAILKGGMELRFLDCPRYTNDLDYVFSPFKSKNEIVESILLALKKIENLTTTYSLNSKCLRILCELNNIKLQIEVNVAKICESQELSTASLATKHNQLARIIRGMKIEVAFANKLAAWNERRLYRDLYDCYYFAIILGIKPDINILKKRLGKIVSRKPILNGIKRMTLEQFIKYLENEIENITQKNVNEQLHDYFTLEELPSLDLKIKSGIAKVVNYLKENL